MHGSNIGPIYRGFPQFFQVNSGVVSRLVSDRFFPIPIESVVLLSYYQPTLYSLDVESALNNSRRKRHVLDIASPSVAVQWVALLLRICEVQGSDLDTGRQVVVLEAPCSFLQLN
jgi:hypothetical protein